MRSCVPEKPSLIEKRRRILSRILIIQFSDNLSVVAHRTVVLETRNNYRQWLNVVLQRRSIILSEMSECALRRSLLHIYLLLCNRTARHCLPKTPRTLDIVVASVSILRRDHSDAQMWQWYRGCHSNLIRRMNGTLLLMRPVHCAVGNRALLQNGWTNHHAIITCHSRIHTYGHASHNYYVKTTTLE